MTVQTAQTITLTSDEVRDALIEGLRKKHKKLLPAGLDNTKVTVKLDVDDDDDFAPTDNFGVVLTLPPAVGKVDTELPLV